MPEVDSDRMGLWGTSFAGGHAIDWGTADRRFFGVVSQVPTVSGYRQSLRRHRCPTRSSKIRHPSGCSFVSGSADGRVRQ
jgi:cephalosporin-C deacetylase-like acetyl esterase